MNTKSIALILLCCLIGADYCLAHEPQRDSTMAMTLSEITDTKQLNHLN